jgi:cation diffusion facilitator family transporter
MRDDAAVRIRAGWLSLAVGVAIFAGKLFAFQLTGSSAVLSDAMESIVNVVAALLLLYSLIVAARPADRDHPYGHGKVEFFSAGVEGTLIAVAALAILVQAGGDLLRGPELRNLDLGLVILAGLAVANGALGSWLIRVGRRHHSLALEADGRHLWTDVVTSVGVLVGLGAVRMTGITLLDPLIAIAVALNILREGWKLVRRAVGGLMDEADGATLERVVESLARERPPWWIDVHGLRAWRSGAVHHIDLHVGVPRYFDADRLHEIDDDIRQAALRALEAPGDVLVHFDPCRPRLCSSCAMPDCPVRAAAFETRPALTLARATRGEEQLETGERVLEAAR